MGHITYNIELSSKPDRLGRSVVMVRFHMKGHLPGRVLTLVRINQAAKFWNPAAEWKKWIVRHPDKERLNQEISDEYDRIKAQVKTWEKEQPNTLLTPKLLSQRFKVGTSDYYFDWCTLVLNDAKDQSYSSYTNKKSAVALFKEFAGEDFLLESISPVIVRDFQSYLRKKPTAQGNKRKGSSLNIVTKRMNVVHEAILVKMGNSPKRAKLLSPWTDVVNVDEAKPNKAKFNEATIERLSNTKVVSRGKVLPHDTAFKVWVLSHLLAGARYSDVVKLKYCEFELNDQGEPMALCYEMLKTGNRMNVPLFDETRTLLKTWWNPNAKPTDYVLPYLKNSESFAKLLTYEQYKAAPFDVRRHYYNRLAYWNQQINKRLKELQVEANITGNLRLHSSRHSFADLARRIMEQDGTLAMYDIQSMLGHSSITITEMYTKSLQERDIIRPMSVIFNRKKV